MPARRPRSTTPSSWTTTTAACTSTCWPTACRTCLGNERLKGSHSMTGYHSMELCYLAAVYTNLLITKQPMDVVLQAVSGWLQGPHPARGAGYCCRRAASGIGSVGIDGKPYEDFDADALCRPAARDERAQSR